MHLKEYQVLKSRTKRDNNLVVKDHDINCILNINFI